MAERNMCGRGCRGIIRGAGVYGPWKSSHLASSPLSPSFPPSSPKRDRERMEVIACCRIIRLNVSSLSRKIAIGQDFPSITLCNRGPQHLSKMWCCRWCCCCWCWREWKLCCRACRRCGQGACLSDAVDGRRGRDAKCQILSDITNHCLHL